MTIEFLRGTDTSPGTRFQRGIWYKYPRYRVNRIPLRDEGTGQQWEETVIEAVAGRHEQPTEIDIERRHEAELNGLGRWKQSVRGGVNTDFLNVRTPEDAAAFCSKWGPLGFGRLAKAGYSEIESTYQLLQNHYYPFPDDRAISAFLKGKEPGIHAMPPQGPDTAPFDICFRVEPWRYWEMALTQFRQLDEAMSQPGTPTMRLRLYPFSIEALVGGEKASWAMVPDALVLQVFYIHAAAKTTGQFTYLCPVCGAAFLSKRRDAKYCSVECHQQEKQRLRRERVVFAKSLRRDGKSPGEIVGAFRKERGETVTQDQVRSFLKDRYTGARCGERARQWEAGHARQQEEGGCVSDASAERGSKEASGSVD